MKMLNLGCGKRFHKDWINIDFYSDNENISSYNLLNGVPYPDYEFDVVYHSHLLEHFSKEEGEQLIKECYRVLKTNGIIRIAVPNLEGIIREYISQLEAAVEGNVSAEINYDWILLELFDQIRRNKNGGAMAELLTSDTLLNEEYIFSRIGRDGKEIREYLLKHNVLHKNSYKNILNNIFKISAYKTLFLKLFFKKEAKFLEIGKFRLSGEVHKYMYDRFSLARLLKKSNFKDIKIVNAFESRISDWEKYELDTKDSEIYKPDSLFIEAIK